MLDCTMICAVSHAGDGLAGLPDGMPRVAVHAAVRSHDRMHHSATSSMDGASIRSQSPRVVQHAVAGDLFLAEVLIVPFAQAVRRLCFGINLC